MWSEAALQQGRVIARLLRDAEESLAGSGAPVPDVLAAYHLRRAGCSCLERESAARLVALRAAAHAQRLLAAQAAGAPDEASRKGGRAPPSRRGREVPEEDPASGQEPAAKVLRVGPLLAALGAPRSGR